ncbi:hypothetical protein [Mycolicibacterium llatzerense]|uniref:Uncharacterized protein n=1 Tax=Mycolicibacterium llatzerense TaxID=280871 RepID=A0A0D1LIM6_9MYCO|nr:hypothetical protein [Mycolicibacterium llatzerense]KIU18332.1 hypothetical protein TL10_02485 [Mycolicibacterium llatzerense]
MNWANPEVLDKLGTASLAVFVCGLFIVALVRGWIVLGRDHRQDLAYRDNENALLRKENDKLLDSNNVLTRAVLEKNVTDDTTNRLLVAFRQAAEAGR